MMPTIAGRELHQVVRELDSETVARVSNFR
jgi:hypothetical protein